jgi:hypothetical protein
MNFELRRANVLQRLTPNKVGPASDLRRDAFDAWELLAHAAGEELSSLYQLSASSQLHRSQRYNIL